MEENKVDGRHLEGVMTLTCSIQCFPEGVTWSRQRARGIRRCRIISKGIICPMSWPDGPQWVLSYCARAPRKKRRTHAAIRPRWGYVRRCGRAGRSSGRGRSICRIPEEGFGCEDKGELEEWREGGTEGCGARRGTWLLTSGVTSRFMYSIHTRIGEFMARAESRNWGGERSIRRQQWSGRGFQSGSCMSRSRSKCLISAPYYAQKSRAGGDVGRGERMVYIQSKRCWTTPHV